MANMPTVMRIFRGVIFGNESCFVKIFIKMMKMNVIIDNLNNRAKINKFSYIFRIQQVSHPGLRRTWPRYRTLLSPPEPFRMSTEGQSLI